jgi:hypothetical protein
LLAMAADRGGRGRHLDHKLQYQHACYKEPCYKAANYGKQNESACWTTRLAHN